MTRLRPNLGCVVPMRVRPDLLLRLLTPLLAMAGGDAFAQGRSPFMPPAAAAPEPSAVETALAAIDPDRLAPREALDGGDSGRFTLPFPTTRNLIKLGKQPSVAAALDETLNEVGYIVPGLGDAGDRLFGQPVR